MTTPTPITACRDAIVALWTSNWAGAEPVLWQQNSVTNTVPDIDVPTWLHLEAIPAAERIAAYGGGPRNAERVLTGTLTITAFAQAGAGEDALLLLLDAAVAALRGHAAGPLTFYSDIHYGGPEEDDGVWQRRSAILAYQYRFTG